MKAYGNLKNRLDENMYFNGTHGNIKVGTYATIYYWSDRHAYEVIEVKDQNHITIRQLDAIRTDKNGMSDYQSYEYKSNPKNHTMNIEKTRYGWKEVYVYTLEIFNKIKERDGFVRGITDKDYEKLLAGKTVKKRFHKIDISFGVADEYYDYSF